MRTKNVHEQKQNPSKKSCFDVKRQFRYRLASCVTLEQRRVGEREAHARTGAHWLPSAIRGPVTTAGVSSQIATDQVTVVFLGYRRGTSVTGVGRRSGITSAHNTSEPSANTRYVRKNGWPRNCLRACVNVCCVSTTDHLITRWRSDKGLHVQYIPGNAWDWVSHLTAAAASSVLSTTHRHFYTCLPLPPF